MVLVLITFSLVLSFGSLILALLLFQMLVNYIKDEQKAKRRRLRECQ